MISWTCEILNFLFCLLCYIRTLQLWNCILQNYNSNSNMASGTMPLSQWVNKELVKLLGIAETDVEDLSSYLVTIDNPEELTTFVTELLSENGAESGLDGPKKQFIRDLLERWERVRVPDNVMVYKKDEDDSFNGGKKLMGKKLLPSSNSNPFDMSKMGESLEGGEKKAKKKTHYVSLYGKDGEMTAHAVMLPGRNICECQAQKHKLVNNCLSCGRVVCEQEGSGPCLFCGDLVCTREEKEVLARKSNKSKKLHEKLINIEGGGILGNQASSNIASALEKARAYKERLLKYDRSCAKRTKVIDDESDYYATDSNIWLSEKERSLLKKREAEMREKRHGSRLNRKVVLDIAGRRVLDDADLDIEYDVTKDEEVMAANFGNHSDEITDDNYIEITSNKENFPEIANPNINGPTPTYLTEVAEKVEKTTNKVWKSSNKRLQDEQLLALSDPGMCLSMHQPWASLLIKGIKRHEGRSWYSNHRGRLWIAAAAKKPTKDEISAIEEQHKLHWQATDGLHAMPELPKEYPVGCLLGCVQVKEVLSQEEYSVKYPGGESGGAYVFVCEDPHELKVLFPVKGKHKIWKIEPKTHLNAKRGLQM
ncbi:activating signal cointegrator 1-like isoform X2 [Ciona intestinalis]